MTKTIRKTASLRFVAVGVLAATMLAGCGGSGKVASASAGSAKAHAVKKGDAVAVAEAAVSLQPRNAATRIALAQAYLKAGRFNSAASTFDDAMELGDNSARTALSLALANVAAGKNREAVALLDDWRETIPASDLGLALALAGETTRGTAILAEGMRSGDASPKLRQNLAYAFALDGRWRDARAMIAQDVPADKVDDRINEWASRGKPEEYQKRVAALLGVPLRGDPGQPTQLALSLTPSGEQMAAEAAASRPEAELAATGELPAVASEVATPGERTLVTPVVPAAQPASTSNFNGFALSQPVVQPIPAAKSPVVRSVAVGAIPAKAIPARVGSRPVVAASGTHRAQLGAFSSSQGARRAWGIFASRNPELRNFRMAISEANVRGKHVWRVAAAGMNSNSASGMCASVKQRGGACFAYATSNPPRAFQMPARANAVRYGGATQKARRR